MRYWNTSALAQELRKDNVASPDQRDYYIGLAIIGLLYQYSGADLESSWSLFSLGETIVLAVVSIVGLRLAYRANGSDDGQCFLPRVVALSFPLLIKLYILSFAIGFVTAVFHAKFGVAVILQSEIAMSLLTVGIEILFFWRLVLHLKFVSAV